MDKRNPTTVIYRVLMFCACCWGGCLAASATTNTKYDQKADYDMSKWGLPMPSEYPDVYKCLDHQNIQKVVFESRDTWVLLFSTKTMDKSWKSLIDYWKGAIFFADVTLKESSMVLENIGLSEDLQGKVLGSILKTTIGIVFPYGGEKMKRKYKICENTGMVIKHVLKGLPANEIYLRSERERSEYLFQAQTSVVPQIPVMVVANPEPKGQLFLAYCRVLASLFKDYFRFAFFTTDDDQNLFAEFFSQKEVGTTNVTVPTMSALIAKTESGQTKYGFFPFARKMMGEVTFINCVYWLYIVNDQFRPTIPHHVGTSYTEEAAEMKSIAKVLKKRAEIFTKCKDRKEEL